MHGNDTLGKKTEVLCAYNNTPRAAGCAVQAIGRKHATAEAAQPPSPALGPHSAATKCKELQRPKPPLGLNSQQSTFAEH